ncbi:MAG: hypothetical protein QM495_05695 [Lutibacter sp.]|uniref:hypothetical protein n=1 Tax=Lutibacter sp. TaxID=1925666 RepID=UPI0038583CBF
MKQIFSFLLFILFLNYSCNRVKNVQEVSEISDTLKTNSSRIVNTISETLIPVAKKEVAVWKEYKNVDEFILKYYNISTTEALDNAKELSELVQIMKDSVRVDLLKQLNITARINVLYNEALRLADMATISSITNEEVKEEVEKIVEVYSAMNSKINTIYKAIELQNSLEVDTENPLEIAEEPKVYKKNNLYNTNTLKKSKSKKFKKVREKRPKKIIEPRKNKLVKPVTFVKKS